MTLLCLQTIIQDLPRCYFHRLLHILWDPQKGCLCHIPYLYFTPDDQLPRGPYFHSCTTRSLDKLYFVFENKLMAKITGNEAGFITYSNTLCFADLPLYKCGHI